MCGFLLPRNKYAQLYWNNELNLKHLLEHDRRFKDYTMVSCHCKQHWQIPCIIKIFVISSGLGLSSSHTCRQLERTLKWRLFVNLGHALTDVQLRWGLALPLCQIYEAHSWGKRLKLSWMWVTIGFMIGREPHGHSSYIHQRLMLLTCTEICREEIYEHTEKRESSRF